MLTQRLHKKRNYRSLLLFLFALQTLDFPRLRLSSVHVSLGLSCLLSPVILSPSSASLLRRALLVESKVAWISSSLSASSPASLCCCKLMFVYYDPALIWIFSYIFFNLNLNWNLNSQRMSIWVAQSPVRRWQVNRIKGDKLWDDVYDLNTSMRTCYQHSSNCKSTAVLVLLHVSRTIL